MTEPLIAIISPVYGHTESASVTLGYASKREMLLRCRNVRMMPESLFFSDDLVRGRSRAAAQALETDATHFLWWDTDVVPEDPIQAVEGMLASDFDVVAAPYPVKRIKARFPYRVSGPDLGTTGLVSFKYCIRIHDIAMGFMLMKRCVLEKMIDTFDAQLWYSDVRPPHPTKRIVAIFAMMFGETLMGPDGKPFRTLDSEDYSFCRRWRSLGGDVHMYVGPKTPLTHVGPYAYYHGPEHMGKTR